MGILAAATLAASIPHQLTLILYFNNLEKVNVGQMLLASDTEGAPTSAGSNGGVL